MSVCTLTCVCICLVCYNEIVPLYAFEILTLLLLLNHSPRLLSTLLLPNLTFLGNSNYILTRYDCLPSIAERELNIYDLKKKSPHLLLTTELD